MHESNVWGAQRYITLFAVVALHLTFLALLFTAPVVAWTMLTTLSADERVMWLIWTWGIVLLVRGLRRYRPRPSATA